MLEKILLNSTIVHTLNLPHVFRQSGSKDRLAARCNQICRVILELFNSKRSNSIGQNCAGGRIF